VVWALFQTLRCRSYVLLYGLLPAALYLGLAMTSHLNIGIRHLLPMFPFVAILGGGFICAVIHLCRSKTLAISLSIITLAPFLLIAISTFPNYLTYFSPLAGGATRGWQTLSDSNVETGQEVKTLAAYLKARGENRVTGIMVGGEFLKFYGVELDDFPSWYDEDDSTDDSQDDSKDDDSETDDNAFTIDTTYVAIGAWYFSEIDLTDRQKQIIDIYRQQQPEAMVGNSIFVFRRVSQKAINY